MYLKIHLSEHTEVIAVCDSDLLGKTITDGKREIIVSEEFYKGEERTEEDIINILKEATNVNLIGKQAVAAGIKAGIIEEANVLTINGIPHAIAYTLQ